jgi:hypothetical protein
MGIAYKSLLPKVMQSNRWGQFIDAFQSIIDDVVTNLVQPIKTRFQYDLMTQDELLDMSARLGYNITYLDGYSSSESYFTKEILSIIPRVKTKTTRPGYQYLYKIFNLVGETFPIYYLYGSNHYTFQVQDNYWTTSIGRNSIFKTLDQVPPLVLDTELILLDSTTLTSAIPLRHFVLSYYNNFIENSTEFLSTNTLQAFYTDVKAMKRATEIPYFEPTIKFNLYSGQVSDVISTPLSDYNNTIVAQQQSILFKNNLSGIAYIQLGNGTYSDIAYATGGVYSQQYIINNNSGELQYIEGYSEIKLHARKLITEKFKFQDSSSGQMYFTEMAFLNSASGCVAYSTFPKIQWYPYMNQSIQFNINLI